MLQYPDGQVSCSPSYLEFTAGLLQTVLLQNEIVSQISYPATQTQQQQQQAVSSVATTTTTTMLNKGENYVAPTTPTTPPPLPTPFTVTTKDRQGAPQTFLVDAMTDGQLSDIYQLIRHYGKAGQGFSLDEYADEAEFRAEVEDGYRFAVMDKGTGRMVAGFILAVSKYSRGCPVADPFIIVRDDQRGRGLGRLCMELCVKLAARLDFLGMYVDTFSNNAAMLKIIGAVPGLMQVGCLPMGGVMSDGQVVSTLIFYKDLRPDNAIRKG